MATKNNKQPEPDSPAVIQAKLEGRIAQQQTDYNSRCRAEREIVSAAREQREQAPGRATRRTHSTATTITRT